MPIPKRFLVAWVVASILLAYAILAISAEAPTAEQQLALCRADLSVTTQLANINSQSRLTVETELAKSRAMVVALQAKLKELSQVPDK